MVILPKKNLASKQYDDHNIDDQFKSKEEEASKKRPYKPRKQFNPHKYDGRY